MPTSISRLPCFRSRSEIVSFHYVKIEQQPVKATKGEPKSS